MPLVNTLESFASQYYQELCDLCLGGLFGPPLK